METSNLVIKVKHGEMLKRFNIQIVNGKLNFTIDGLRQKILSFFNFAHDTLFTLTYADEDDDEVTLVDDDDLRDAVSQDLNPLRITVKLNGEKNDKPHTHPSGTSTPLRSPPVQPLPNLNYNIPEILKSVPEPLQETVKKLLTELVSKVSSSAPGIAELINHFSELGLSYLGQVSGSQSGVQSNAHNEVRESTTDAKLHSSSQVDPSTLKAQPSIRLDELLLKSLESSAKRIPGTTMGLEKNEVKPAKMKGCSTEASSSKVPEAENVNVGNPYIHAPSESIDMDAKPTVDSVSFFSQGKCPAGTFASGADSTEKVSNKPSNLSTGVKDVPTIQKLKSGLDYLQWKKAKMGAPSSYPPHTPWNYADGSIRRVFRDGVWMDPRPVNMNPFSGVPVGNERSSGSQDDGTGNIFHRGVRCDHCGIRPITGPRFKSKVKEDYDLCSICFTEMGNESDYIRMDHPLPYPHPLLFKGLHGRHVKDWGASRPQVIRGSKLTVAPKLDSRFIQDMNIADGTMMAPLTPFTKIWRMKNTGTIGWPERTQLVWIEGDKLTNALAIDVEVPAAGLAVGQELDVAVDFVAPELPGRYISYWKMASPTGKKFGQRVWVLIQVDASLREPPHASVRDLNLNLPPPNNGSNGPETISADLEPMVEDSLSEPGSSNYTMQNGEPMVYVQPINEEEKRFPINDSLFVGSGASDSFSSAPPSSVSHPIIVPLKVAPHPSVLYPIIDLSEVAPPFPTQAQSVPAMPPPLTNAQASSPSQPQTDPGVPPPLAHGQASSPSQATVTAMPPPLAKAQQSSQLILQKDEAEEKLLRASSPSQATVIAVPPPLARAQESSQLIPQKDEAEEKLLRELDAMGFKQVDLNKEILSKNQYDFQQTVDDLCSFSQWDPILELREMDEAEEKILRELDAMGFKQVDLNEEILRKNQYDFQQTVDDLCSFSEWDPILDELREMGFHDRELNKKLLQKHDGSIMRVVMDLIAGQQ